VLEQHLPGDAPALSPGPFVTPSGEVLGEHAGFARYTVGQRRGLPGGRSLPLYVLAIRPEDRAVVVGSAEQLGSRTVRLTELNWLASPLAVGSRCEVQIRYRAPAVCATVTQAGDGSLALETDSSMRAVTPGQSGVLYSAQGQVLGGGVIS
jgi:tRNA-specific 2-thiouridylase